MRLSKKEAARVAAATAYPRTLDIFARSVAALPRLIAAGSTELSALQLAFRVSSIANPTGVEFIDAPVVVVGRTAAIGRGRSCEAELSADDFASGALEILLVDVGAAWKVSELAAASAPRTGSSPLFVQPTLVANCTLSLAKLAEQTERGTSDGLAAWTLADMVDASGALVATCDLAIALHRTVQGSGGRGHARQSKAATGRSPNRKPGSGRARRRSPGGSSVASGGGRFGTARSPAKALSPRRQQQQRERSNSFDSENSVHSTRSGRSSRSGRTSSSWNSRPSRSGQRPNVPLFQQQQQSKTVVSAALSAVIDTSPPSTPPRRGAPKLGAGGGLVAAAANGARGAAAAASSDEGHPPPSPAKQSIVLSRSSKRRAGAATRVRVHDAWNSTSIEERPPRDSPRRANVSSPVTRAQHQREREHAAAPRRRRAAPSHAFGWKRKGSRRRVKAEAAEDVERMGTAAAAAPPAVVVVVPPLIVVEVPASASSVAAKPDVVTPDATLVAEKKAAIATAPAATPIPNPI